MTIRKSIVCLVFAAALSFASLSAQQITRFAVIDTTRIYTTFYRDSRNVRDYETKNTQYQGEIQRMTDEIKNLRQQKVDLDPNKDQPRILKLESEITAKTSFLLEYSKAKNSELDTLKKKLLTDDQFYSTLYDVIRKIAEADGYSMVMSLQENTSIIWYSSTVDITDKVLRNMTISQ